MNNVTINDVYEYLLNKENLYPTYYNLLNKLNRMNNMDKKIYYILGIKPVKFDEILIPDIFIDSLNEFNQIISNIDDTNDYLLIRKQILLNEYTSLNTIINILWNQNILSSNKSIEKELENFEKQLKEIEDDTVDCCSSVFWDFRDKQEKIIDKHLDLVNDKFKENVA